MNFENLNWTWWGWEKRLIYDSFAGRFPTRLCRSTSRRFAVSQAAVSRVFIPLEMPISRERTKSEWRCSTCRFVSSRILTKSTSIILVSLSPISNSRRRHSVKYLRTAFSLGFKKWIPAAMFSLKRRIESWSTILIGTMKSLWNGNWERIKNVLLMVKNHHHHHHH